MCLFDRFRYTCGHMCWGKTKYPCEGAVAPRPVDIHGKEIPCLVVRARNYVRFDGHRPCSACKTPFSMGYTPPIDRRFIWFVYTRRPRSRRSLNCSYPDCLRRAPHPLPHELAYSSCSTNRCDLYGGHPGPHRGFLLFNLRDLEAHQGNEIRRLQQERLLYFTALVLYAMGSRNRSQNVSFATHRVNTRGPIPRQSLVMARRIAKKQSVLRDLLGVGELTSSIGKPYHKLDLRRQQIRLFELFPSAKGKDVEGVFHYVELSRCPPYTALSYTWGDPAIVQSINIRGTGTFKVRSNLYAFLRQQSHITTQSRLFWIDALCIDQSNIHERNHQVNLMKDIYVSATKVFVWLGPQSTDSDVAMAYIRKQGSQELKPRCPGFHDVWTKEQGKAVRDLCDRPYWRRMWIIQEVAYARAITVWCGPKSFDWAHFERLYLKLKTLEDTNWFTHHEYVIDVLQSSAAVMAWQRAHWRHQDTPIPSLRTLIQIFRQWQCADVRDKVFALVNMASPETAVLPNYALSPRDLYYAVRNTHPNEDAGFANMLSQVLGLSSRDVNYNFGRHLIEYRVHAPENLILKKRCENDW